MAKIGVVGSGSWGTAFSVMLADNGHSVTLWSYDKDECEGLKKYGENKPFLPGVKLPENISFTTSLEECTKNAEVVVLATPSHFVRSTCKNLAPYIAENQYIVNLGKGFDTETLQRLSEVIKEEIPQANVSVMSGPSHAEEVGKRIPTTNVVANTDIKVAQYIQELFMSPVFRIYASDDVIGVEIGGALKNIIALCAGVSDGLGFGDNTKAALMTRGLAEMIRLGVKMGAKQETFSGLTGIGDLIVTCTSMHSRNRRAGILIGQGKSVEDAQAEVKMVVEGVKTTEGAYKLAKKYGVDMPITESAYSVVFEGKLAKDVVKSLMSRTKKNEREDWIFIK